MARVRQIKAIAMVVLLSLPLVVMTRTAKAQLLQVLYTVSMQCKAIEGWRVLVLLCMYVCTKVIARNIWRAYAKNRVQKGLCSSMYLSMQLEKSKMQSCQTKILDLVSFLLNYVLCIIFLLYLYYYFLSLQQWSCNKF